MDFFIGEFSKSLNGSAKTWRSVIGVMWFFVPLTIFAFGRFVANDAGECVEWRPPSPTYSIMWVTLVLSLMFSWLLISRNAPMDSHWISMVFGFFLIVGLAILWIFLYKENKANGISIFIALITVVLTSIPIAMKINIFSGALLMPILVWSIFNLVINCAEVQCVNNTDQAYIVSN